MKDNRMEKIKQHYTIKQKCLLAKAFLRSRQLRRRAKRIGQRPKTCYGKAFCAYYTIVLNGQNYKVLKHKIDTDKSLLTIKTKILGQDFPHGENISVSTAEDNDQTVIVAWKGMWKDEKVEHWEYKIVT